MCSSLESGRCRCGAGRVYRVRVDGNQAWSRCDSYLPCSSPLSRSLALPPSLRATVTERSYYRSPTLQTISTGETNPLISLGTSLLVHPLPPTCALPNPPYSPSPFPSSTGVNVSTVPRLKEEYTVGGGKVVVVVVVRDLERGEGPEQAKKRGREEGRGRRMRRVRRDWRPVELGLVRLGEERGDVL